MRMIVTGAVTALLAACNNSGGGNMPADAGASSPPALDETQRRVVAMSDAERAAVMIRAIRGARQACQHVDSAAAVDNAGGAPAYLATCDGRTRYVVTIGRNGAGSVTVPTEGQPR